MKLEISRQIFDNYSMKIRPAGAKFFLAVERTDLTKLIAAFINFAKTPKEDTFIKYPMFRELIQ
jgi:hypothetical protein